MGHGFVLLLSFGGVALLYGITLLNLYRHELIANEINFFIHCIGTIFVVQIYIENQWKIVQGVAQIQILAEIIKQLHV